VSAQDRRAWWSQARCRSVSVHIFFPRQGDHLGVQVARSIRRRCPVRDDCAASVWELLDDGESLYGVWAGVNVADRRQRRILRAAAGCSAASAM
jgi:hypothetical protein